MGTTCSDDSEWCQGEPITKEKTRQRFTQAKLGQKDLVQVKNSPISRDYTIISPPIGKGSFGSVYKIVNKQTGMERVAKKISRKSKNRDTMQEIILLKKLDHPNIVRILDIYEEQLFIFVVMQYCSGGQLFDRIVQRKKMTESSAKKYMKQILGAISYCHLNNVMHRDLKPENIMLISEASDDLKIIDFGAGKIKEKNEMSTLKVGSVYYIAPEVIKKEYDEKCDIWSLGVILYMMISGDSPFNGRTDKIIFDKILKGTFSFPSKKWSKVSPQVKDLINKMLQYSPEKRISAKKALKHAWFQNDDETEETNLYLANEMTSIQKYCQMNKFQSSIITFISHNLLSAKQISKLEKKFNEIDKNKDGKISWTEFRDCYHSTMNPQLQDEKIEQLFLKLDKNNSGYIDYSEFVTSATTIDKNQENEILNKAFNLIDTNNNGYLSKDEVISAFGGINEEIYNQMICQCDLDKDGQISRDEFILAMRKLTKPKQKKKY